MTPVPEAGPVAVSRGVVLLHGQPGSAADWNAVIAHLPENLHPLALDRPGYRSSRHPPSGFTDNARWMLDELDHAGLQSAILVGHSYGGGVALATAALAPQRVSGLVLVSSVGPGCLDHWDTLLAAPISGPVCALAAWWLTPWFARRRLARIERIRGRTLHPHEHLSWDIWGNARHEHGAMWRTFLTEQRELVHGLDELTAAIGTISAPTIVIADPSDRMIPIGTAQALTAGLQSARLVVADAGGHHLPRRRPEFVADQIVALAAALP